MYSSIMAWPNEKLYMVIIKDLLIPIFHNLMENILLVTAVEEMRTDIIGSLEEWMM